MSNYTNKKNREFAIFLRLLQGEYISVKELAQEYQLSAKSISRDITDLKNFIYDNWDNMEGFEIKYSYQEKAYYLERGNFISSKELMALVKILIASRSLSGEQMRTIINKLESFLSVNDKKLVHTLLQNELYHYMPVGADCENVIDNLWNISQSIRKQKEISIEYFKMNRSQIFRRVKPLAIVFSEYYFYLIASHSVDGRDVEHFYRIDRITKIEKHRTGFQVNYAERFDEGELKNRIQYMWPGQGIRRTVVFTFQGPSVQAVLDKLPGAEIIKKEEGRYTIRAEVYGDGIKMFLLSQGSWVKVLEPEAFVKEMKEEIIAMKSNYEEM